MTPKYQAIADELRVHIQAGKYVNAQTLPTEFAIAEEYQVSRQTVRQALSVLAKEGLIEKRQGSGSHITRRETETAWESNSFCGSFCFVKKGLQFPVGCGKLFTVRVQTYSIGGQ